MSGLNEHQAFLAYQEQGLAGLSGQSTEQQLALARILSTEVTRMDQRHPSTEIVKRDIAQIYRQANPEATKAPDAARQKADQAIATLKAHPAYLDKNHAEHASVAAQISQAYAVRYQGES